MFFFGLTTLVISQLLRTNMTTNALTETCLEYYV